MARAPRSLAEVSLRPLLPWLCPAHPPTPAVIYKLFRHLDPLEEVTLACSAAPSGCHAVLEKWHTRVCSQYVDRLSTPITLAPPASSSDIFFSPSPLRLHLFLASSLAPSPAPQALFCPATSLSLPPFRVSTYHSTVFLIPRPTMFTSSLT